MPEGIMRPVHAASIAISLAMSVSPLVAQTGAMEGGVSSDSLGKRNLPGAEVSIPALQITTHTNFAGEYRITGIGPGRYLVIATALGFRGVADSVTIAPSGSTYHDFVLTTKAVTLDSVVATAPSPVRKFISPALNDFEQRRTSGKGGYFVSEDQLRKDDGRQLGNEIAANIPGVIMTIGGTLLSGRTMCKGTVLSCSKPNCFVTVFVDGVPIYASAGGPSQMPPPNFSRMQTEDYAGIEFYAGGASLPSQFNGPGSECGVLLLWTRER